MSGRNSMHRKGIDEFSCTSHPRKPIRLGGRNGKALCRPSGIESWMQQRTFSSTAQEDQNRSGTGNHKEQEEKS